MRMFLKVALGLLSLTALVSSPASAARKGAHFDGGYGPHHRGGHEVGGRTVHHPIRALLRRL